MSTHADSPGQAGQAIPGEAHAAEGGQGLPGPLHNLPPEPQALCAGIAGRPDDPVISLHSKSLAEDLRASLEDDLSAARESLEASAGRLEEGLERARALGEVGHAGAVAVAARTLRERAGEAASVVSRFVEGIPLPWTRSHGAAKRRIAAAEGEARRMLEELGAEAIERIRREGLATKPGPLRIRLDAGSLPDGVEGLDVRVNVEMKDGYEISDPAAVPRELCIPDARAIAKEIKAGREVPGVARTQSPSVTVYAPKPPGGGAGAGKAGEEG